MPKLEIPTAITLREASTLVGFAKGRNVLEIGSLLGYSTILMAKVAKRVISIDPHVGYPESDPRPTLEPFMENLKEHQVANVIVCVARDWQMIPYIKPESFGLIFIDITGRYYDVLHAMERAVPLLTPNGVLAVHDCGHADWPGAAQAVDRFAMDRGIKYDTIDKLAVFTCLNVVL